jgi:hypothetical protein
MKITNEIKISDNGFVFNSRTGDSFNLNPFGLELLRHIEAEKDFDLIKNDVLERFDIDDLTFEKDFYEFCALLKHHQIISQDDPMDFK